MYKNNLNNFRGMKGLKRGEKFKKKCVCVSDAFKKKCVRVRRGDKITQTYDEKKPC